MDVVIIAQYMRDIEHLDSNNNRYVYLANMLSQHEDISLEVITSDFMHVPKCHAVHVESPKTFQLTALKEPGYRKNICLKRIWSHGVLAGNLRKYLAQRKKPDCIYCAVPSLDVADTARKYCRKNGIRLIVDVQDLWPEAFKMAFRVPVISNLVFYPLMKMADRIYGAADDIVGVSDAYCQRAASVNRKHAGTTSVYIGTSLDGFDENAASQSPVLEKTGDEIFLGYCGTLGRSYDLVTVMDALAILKEKTGRAPVFVVMGDGVRMEEFKAYAEKKQVDVRFLGILRYSNMCSQLKACDIAVNPIIGSSAASIINKHADYVAAGLPVLNTQASPEYRGLVDSYQMGFNCESGNPQDLADKMQILMEDPQLRETMGRNARRCGEEKFDRKHTYPKLVKLIAEGKR